MDETTTKPLVHALANRERAYFKALERLRELATDRLENEVYDLTRELGEAVELVRCLRRLVDGRTVQELHKAFGAPGDFGYETPIGDALARVYGVRT